jgi:hypothetical protein
MVTERIPALPPALPPGVRTRVRQTLEGIPGIAELLASPNAPKFYVVLANTDFDRDYEIVGRLLSLGDELGTDLDYDLVPEPSVGMIPACERL